MGHRVSIDQRFNGPPDSANGGYACGLIAKEIEGPAEVTLRSPPPLVRELRLEREGERVLMLDDDQLVGEGTPVDPDWQVPAPVTVELAAAAARRSPFLARPRPFVSCFVCGPDREAGDGLAIFPGPVEGRDLHAGTWTPDASVADDDGLIRPEIVWASLDCPTSGPVANWHAEGEPLRPIVLARLAVDVRGHAEVGREHVVTAWQIAVEGRKRHAGSALFTGDGELVASARALWIELKPEP
jgi:hypothetical protein